MNSAVRSAFDAFCKSIEKNAWFGVLLFAVAILLLVSAHNKLQRLKLRPRPYSGSFVESFVQSSGSTEGSASSHAVDNTVRTCEGAG